MIAGRLSAGVLLGFPLACAVGGLIIALTPVSYTHLTLPTIYSV